jgi:hypothetical protein
VFVVAKRHRSKGMRIVFVNAIPCDEQSEFILYPWDNTGTDILALINSVLNGINGDSFKPVNYRSIQFPFRVLKLLHGVDSAGRLNHGTAW